jgi:Glycosyltransferase family 92
LGSWLLGGLSAASPSGSTGATTEPFGTELPSLADDNSELVLGSIIERVSESWDLYLTTFMVTHFMLEPIELGTAAHNIRNSSLERYVDAIDKFKMVEYFLNGRRKRKPKFFCRIKNHENATAYTVLGQFVPNKLTPDGNANRRLDTFRCKMQDSQNAYMSLARTSENVLVEILRETKPIISFKVSWKTRAQGYSITSPVNASTFDMWKGFDKAQPGNWTHDRVHMCVPGLDSPPARKNLAIYLEFIQHHLLMGVDHIHGSLTFTWGSEHMTRYVRLLRSYISEGLVSLTSHTRDGDFLYSTEGVSWHRDTMKIFQINMCFFLTKGVTDYVAVWDNDEFFIPKGKNKNMLDVIRAAESPTPLQSFPSDDATFQHLKHTWKGGPGWADGYAHPFCYLQMHSSVVANPKVVLAMDIDMNHLWVGERFPNGPELPGSRLAAKFGFKKSILPTRTIFQVALHMSGACKLPWPWHGCNQTVEYCEGPDPWPTLTIEGVPFHTGHRFDQIVMDNDTRSIDTETEAVLYHFMQYRYFETIELPETVNKTNDYASIHFNNTLKELRRRNLDVVITLPEHAPRGITADVKWTDYNLVYDSRETPGTLFPGMDWNNNP